MTLDFSQTHSLRIVGVHLAGSHTHKTAVVRASVALKSLLVSLTQASFSKPLEDYIKTKIPKLAIQTCEDESVEQNSTPLLWEAFCPEIGASPYRSSDARLLEVLEDMGRVDIFCIDAALTLPPCLSCTCELQNGFECQDPIVEKMQQEWDERRVQGARTKTRPLQPYLDRYFEVHARRYFDECEHLLGFEFDAVMGSGRAPITSRAIRLVKDLERRFPNALILETNSTAALVGWALHAGYDLDRSVGFRHGNEGRATRAGLLRKLEQARCATRSAIMHEGLFDELSEHLETFLAAMSALSAWGFLNGNVHMIEEFLLLDKTNPLRGWSCLPKDDVWLKTRSH